VNLNRLGDEDVQAKDMYTLKTSLDAIFVQLKIGKLIFPVTHGGINC